MIKRLAMSTDACDSFWSGVETKVPFVDLKLAPHDQLNEPVAFLSDVSQQLSSAGVR